MRSSQATVVTREADVGPLRRARLPQLDAARVIAIFAIVWIHTPRSPAFIPTIALARFAVPFFVIASMLLMLKGFDRHPSRTAPEFIWGRLRRVGLPFATWTLVYLLFKVAKRIVAPDQANAFPGWEIAVFGSAYHLWFLPFILIASTVMAFLARPILNSEHPREIGVGAALAAVACALTPLQIADSQWDGLLFMWLAVPAALSAIPLYFLLQQPIGQWRYRFQPATLILVLMLSAAYLALVGRNATAETIAGCSFLLLFIQLPTRSLTCWLAQFAPLSYGVYLSHLLFIKIGESASSHLQIRPNWLLDLVIFTVAVWGSTSLSWLLSRSRMTRWSIGL